LAEPGDFQDAEGAPLHLIQGIGKMIVHCASPHACLCSGMCITVAHHS